jgi:[NiFe] hydrogenase large subunit
MNLLAFCSNVPDYSRFFDVTRAWYNDGVAKHPYKGETKPLQEDPKYTPGDGKYFWFKTPRYEGEPCEVGPLTRVLVAYARVTKTLSPLWIMF